MILSVGNILWFCNRAAAFDPICDSKWDPDFGAQISWLTLHMTAPFMVSKPWSMQIIKHLKLQRVCLFGVQKAYV